MTADPMETITAEQFAQLQNNRMLERDLEEFVRQAARRHGWRYYHTRRSKGSPTGFLDDVLLRGADAIVVELKRERETLTPDQLEWRTAWRRVNRLWVPDVWRPSDRDEIERVLEHGIPAGEGRVVATV